MARERGGCIGLRSKHLSRNDDIIQHGSGIYIGSRERVRGEGPGIRVQGCPLHQRLSAFMHANRNAIAVGRPLFFARICCSCCSCLSGIGITAFVSVSPKAMYESWVHVARVTGMHMENSRHHLRHISHVSVTPFLSSQNPSGTREQLKGYGCKCTLAFWTAGFFNKVRQRQRNTTMGRRFPSHLEDFRPLPFARSAIQCFRIYRSTPPLTFQ